MTQPQTPTVEEDIEQVGTLANVQGANLVLAFGVFANGNGVDLRRVAIPETMADSLRPRVQSWIRDVAAREPVSYEPGHRPDPTEVAFIQVAGNAAAAAVNAASYPPAGVPSLTDRQFLLHAAFLAVILTAGNLRGTVLKRITPSKVVLKPDRKFFGLLSDNATLQAVESPIIEIDHAYHALLTVHYVYMPALDDAERLFGFDLQLAQKQSANAAAIAAALPVTDSDALNRLCQGNRTYRKKLQSVVDRGVFNRPVRELRNFAQAEGLNLQFIEANGFPVLVVEENRRWLAEFLRFLDEDFVTGGITSTKYVANSKRPRGQ
jgi:hypothetical protein